MCDRPPPRIRYRPAKRARAPGRASAIVLRVFRGPHRRNSDIPRADDERHRRRPASNPESRKNSRPIWPPTHPPVSMPGETRRSSTHPARDAGVRPGPSSAAFCPRSRLAPASASARQAPSSASGCPRTQAAHPQLRHRIAQEFSSVMVIPPARVSHRGMATSRVARKRADERSTRSGVSSSDLRLRNHCTSRLFEIHRQRHVGV